MSKVKPFKSSISKVSKLSPTLPTPLIKSPSVSFKSDLFTGSCIKAAINYLKIHTTESASKILPAELIKKLQSTTYNTIVENLISLMQKKGYPNINITKVMTLYNYLFFTEINRKDVFECIYSWAGKPCNIPAKKMRNLLTFSGTSLESGTKMSEEVNKNVYHKDINAAGSGEPLLDSEFYYFKKVLEAKKKIKLKSGILANSVTKFKCSKCWLCGHFIHMYKYKGTIVLESCGEDEHVLPPGIGNLVGLLEPTYKATIKYFHETLLLQHGLRASHAWCNQAKSDINFIKPPAVSAKTGAAKGWTVNDVGINQFLDIATKRLTIGSSDAPSDYYYSYESIFQKKLKPDTAFITNMRKAITTHINNICVEANKLVGNKHPNNTPYTSALIRLIFNCCYMGNNHLNLVTDKQWQSHKGGTLSEYKFESQKGGTLSEDDLDYMCNDIMNFASGECNPICNNMINCALPDDIALPDDSALLDVITNDDDGITGLNSLTTLNNIVIQQIDEDLNEEFNEELNENNQIYINFRLPIHNYPHNILLNNEMLKIYMYATNYDIDEGDSVSDIISLLNTEPTEPYNLRETPQRTQYLINKQKKLSEINQIYARFNLTIEQINRFNDEFRPIENFLTIQQIQNRIVKMLNTPKNIEIQNKNQMILNSFKKEYPEDLDDLDDFTPLNQVKYHINGGTKKQNKKKNKIKQKNKTKKQNKTNKIKQKNKTKKQDKKTR